MKEILKHAFSDHLTVKVTGFKDGSSPIYVWGYDRKFYFEDKSAPLFIVGERDINNYKCDDPEIYRWPDDKS